MSTQNKRPLPKPELSIPLYACTLHIQGFGIQQYTEHEVVPARRPFSVGDARVVRLVISGRDPITSLDPCYDAVMRFALINTEKTVKKYNLKGVFTALASSTKAPIEVEEEYALPPPAKKMRTCTEQEPRHQLLHDPIIFLRSDTIPTFVPPDNTEKWKKFLMELPPGYVETKESLDSLLLNGTFQSYMRRNNMTVTVEMPEILGGKSFVHGRLPMSTKRYRPGSHFEINSKEMEPLLPGDIVHRSVIQMFYNITETVQNKFTLNKDHWAMNPAIFLPQIYKNGMEYIFRIQEYLSLCERFKRRTLSAALNGLEDHEIARVRSLKDIDAIPALQSMLGDSAVDVHLEDAHEQLSDTTAEDIVDNIRCILESGTGSEQTIAGLSEEYGLGRMATRIAC